jgi:hypothetical protein
MLNLKNLFRATPLRDEGRFELAYLRHVIDAVDLERSSRGFREAEGLRRQFTDSSAGFAALVRSNDQPLILRALALWDVEPELARAKTIYERLSAMAAVDEGALNEACVMGFRLHGLACRNGMLRFDGPLSAMGWDLLNEKIKRKVTAEIESLAKLPDAFPPDGDEAPGTSAEGAGNHNGPSVAP